MNPRISPPPPSTPDSLCPSQKMILPKLGKIDLLEERLNKAVRQDELAKAEDSLRRKQSQLESSLSKLEQQVKAGLSEKKKAGGALTPGSSKSAPWHVPLPPSNGCCMMGISLPKK